MVAASCIGPPPPPPTTTSVPSSPSTSMAPPTTSDTTPPGTGAFGVNASAGARFDGPALAVDLGARWVRVNASIDGSTGDLDKLRRWLDQGFNLVITMDHRQPGNVVTTYGTLREHPRAGFPYRDATVFSQSLTAQIQPLAGYLDQGRSVILQSENEIGDASYSKSIFWRGTIDDYLTLERTFYETVKSVDPRFGVSLTSWPSQAMTALADPDDPRHAAAEARSTKLLDGGTYDAVDLHFYGCTSQIAAGATWFAGRLKPGTYWISTENAGPTIYCNSVFSNWRGNLDRFEQEKAAEVPQRLQACVASGGRVCLWFSLFNLDDEVDWANHLGLVSTSGATSVAYDSFKQLVG